MKSTEIHCQASSIAGALWDDRAAELRVRPLAEQIEVIASLPAHGTDGDLTDSDRAALRALSQEARL